MNITFEKNTFFNKVMKYGNNEQGLKVDKKNTKQNKSTDLTQRQDQVPWKDD